MPCAASIFSFSVSSAYHDAGLEGVATQLDLAELVRLALVDLHRDDQLVAFALTAGLSHLHIHVAVVVVEGGDALDVGLQVLAIQGPRAE